MPFFLPVHRFPAQTLVMDYRLHNTLKLTGSVANANKKNKLRLHVLNKNVLLHKVCVMMNLYLTQALKRVQAWWIANELNLFGSIFMRYKKLAMYGKVHRDARAAETMQTLVRDTQWRISI